MTCSCCGEHRDAAELTALRCHPEVQVRRGCIGWLVETSGTIDLAPTLPVLDMEAAVEFYEAAGFEVRGYEGGGYRYPTVGGCAR